MKKDIISFKFPINTPSLYHKRTLNYKSLTNVYICTALTAPPWESKMDWLLHGGVFATL